jgi:hypothetical protein
VSFAAVTLCVASQRVFLVLSIYFIIDSVRKLLDSPPYMLSILVRTIEFKDYGYKVLSCPWII